MGTRQFEKLSKYMPKIAEMVNAFSSEAVQYDAFHALLATFEGRPIKRPSRSILSRKDSSVLMEQFGPDVPKSSRSSKTTSRSDSVIHDDVETDLSEGGSIHSFIDSK